MNWLWDKTPNIQSANVNGVVDEINGLWDFAYTSIEVDRRHQGPAVSAGP